MHIYRSSHHLICCISTDFLSQRMHQPLMVAPLTSVKCTWTVITRAPPLQRPSEREKRKGTHRRKTLSQTVEPSVYAGLHTILSVKLSHTCAVTTKRKRVNKGKKVFESLPPPNPVMPKSRKKRGRGYHMPINESMHAP